MRQPIRVPNVELDARYETCGHERVRSELAVPLVFKERLIGVLDLESERYNALSEDDERLLSTLASYVAIALENASLYERLREDERKLDLDLKTARGIQKYLLPKKTPWTPGLQLAVAYSPARHLGGDIYDVVSYGKDRTAVAIGDVAGKVPGCADLPWAEGFRKPLRGFVDVRLRVPPRTAARCAGGSWWWSNRFPAPRGARRRSGEPVEGGRYERAQAQGSPGACGPCASTFHRRQADRTRAPSGACRLAEPPSCRTSRPDL